MLLDPPSSDTAGVLVVAEAAAALAVFDDILAGVFVLLVDLVDEVAAASLLVSVAVPSETRSLAVNGAVVLVNPGQLVLPMTVMVEGCPPPSLTAFFPVSQLHSLSPGQQYL